MKCTNFRCGLDADESDNMVFATCDLQGDKVLTDAKYFSKAVDYEMVIVACPPRCGESATVLGRTVFHPQSTVCGAGIVDGSIPRSGGLMGVIRSPGQESYEAYVKTNGIVITKGGKSDWSFSTLRIESPDMAKSDIRILDDQGLPSWFGRVEFRVGGKWGTVSNDGTNKAFARLVCRALNYKDGLLLNSDRGFCQTYKGKDFCGFVGQPVHYNKYQCTMEDDILTDCTREVPGSFSHE